MVIGRDCRYRVPDSRRSSWRSLVFLIWGGTARCSLEAVIEGLPLDVETARIVYDAEPVACVCDSPNHHAAPGGPSRGGDGAPLLPGKPRTFPLSQTAEGHPLGTLCLRRHIGPPGKGPSPNVPWRTSPAVHRWGGSTSSTCRPFPSAPLWRPPFSRATTRSRRPRGTRLSGRNPSGISGSRPNRRPS